MIFNRKIYFSIKAFSVTPYLNCLIITGSDDGSQHEYNTRKSKVSSKPNLILSFYFDYKGHPRNLDNSIITDLLIVPG